MNSPDPASISDYGNLNMQRIGPKITKCPSTRLERSRGRSGLPFINSVKQWSSVCVFLYHVVKNTQHLGKK